MTEPRARQARTNTVSSSSDTSMGAVDQVTVDHCATSSSHASKTSSDPGAHAACNHGASAKWSSRASSMSTFFSSGSWFICCEGRQLCLA